MKSIQRRKTLHILLKSIVEEVTKDKTPRVFYNHPGNLKMIYPCVVYRQIEMRNHFAGNIKYHTNTFYEIQVMHKLPDDEIVDIILEKINTAVFKHSYTADNIIHTIIEVNTGGFL